VSRARRSTQLLRSDALQARDRFLTIPE